MNNKDFSLIMARLVAYYDRFEFPLMPNGEMENMKFNVWRDALSIIPSDRLEYVIKDYCTKNVYAPTSPTSLIEHYRSIILNYYPSAEIEFEKFIERVRLNGYDLEKHIQGYHRYPYIQETLRRLKSDFEVWRLDKKQLPFFKNRFIDHYNKIIQDNVNEERLKIGE